MDGFNFKYRALGQRDPACRECHRAYNRSHYVRNRTVYIANARRNSAAYRRANIAALMDYLASHPCVDCGESDPMVLEFDHRNQGTKRLAVSLMIRDYSWEQIAREIALCDVRCANCHRRRTARQLGWWRASFSVTAAP